ncbi:MAG: response regulator, partial [Pseudomonadota bacterium]
LLADLKNDPQTRNIPVMMLSGENHMDQVKASLNLGANDYLVKPFRNGVLVNKIQKLLEKAQNRRKDYYYVG